MTPKQRREGEIVRLRAHLARMRAHVESIEIGISAGGPLGEEASQGLTMTALTIASTMAKHDAFALAEGDAKCWACSGTGRMWMESRSRHYPCTHCPAKP